MSFRNYLQRLRQYLKSARAPRRAPRPSAARLRVEPLETRDLLSGFWTGLVNPVPNAGGAQQALLLSDGTVMVQGVGVSNAWYKLTPDWSGNYAHGTWTTLAPMHISRQHFASNVLPNGKVLVLGGEYSSDPDPNLFGGALTPTGEIYDPVANTWTNIASFPTHQFGEAPTAVLPNGQVLAGSINGPQTYIYNPASNTWTQTGSKLRNDASYQETWVTLPDGSILSYDIWSSVSGGTPHAQRYVPSLGQWQDTATLPALLSTASASSDYDVGPALLLPDGRAFFPGGTGSTAYYTPPTTATGPGSWAAGPNLPTYVGGQYAQLMVTSDTPTAMLPDGDVLLLAYAPLFPSSPRVYEFHPTTGLFEDVTPSGFTLSLSANGTSSGYTVLGGSLSTSMLMLPNGQVLMTNGSGQLDFYTSTSGSPAASWAPTIGRIDDTGNGTFALTGTQLNGLSEGANGGDDFEMSSNYPIVRLTDTSGTVRYARTTGWSPGVATGSTPQTVQFSLPAGAPAVNRLSVIANGIASAPVLFVRGDPSLAYDSITLDSATVPDAPPTISVTENGATTYWAPPSAVFVEPGAGSATVTLDSTLSGIPTTIVSGSGTDTVNVGNGTLNNIAGAVTINYGKSKGTPTSSCVVNVNDGNYSGGDTYTVTASTVGVARLPGFQLHYSAISNLTLNTGSGADTINLTPSGATQFSVNAGLPGPPTLPGDVLNVALGGVTSPSLAMSGPGSGEWTFGNCLPVDFTGVETVTVAQPANPGFETPGLGTGFQYDPAGASWTFAGTAGVAGNGSVFTGSNPNAPQGSQVAFLQQNGSFSQTIGFAAGTYVIGFSAAQRAGQSQTFQVQVDGVAVSTFTPAGSSYNPYSTASFNVTAGSHSIAFVGLTPNSVDNTAFIDQVVISASTPQFADPGFELPSQGTGIGASHYRPTGSSWTFVGTAGLAGNGSIFTSSNPPAPQGTQVAFLQQTGSFSQTIGFAAGTYVISFYAAQRGNSQASSQTFQVTVDGTVMGTFTPTGTSYNTYSTAAFTVTAGSHSIAFVGIDPNGGDNTALIDQVSITPARTKK